MNIPLVTIITPTFNLLAAGREAFFAQMLQSIQQQSYPEIEHLIIDGASNDGTVTYVERLIAAKPNVRLLSEPDTGIYAAMNKGVRHAKGDMVAFMNTDDYYSSNSAMTDFVTALVTNPTAGYACGHVNVIEGKRPWLFKAKFSRVFWEMPFCTQGMLARRELFTCYGGFDEKFRIVGDYDFVLRITKGRVRGIYLDKTFATFRAGGASSQRVQTRAEIGRALKTHVYTQSFITEKECQYIAQGGFVLTVKLLRALLCESWPQGQRCLVWSALLVAGRKTLHFRPIVRYLEKKWKFLLRFGNNK